MLPSARAHNSPAIHQPDWESLACTYTTYLAMTLIQTMIIDTKNAHH